MTMRAPHFLLLALALFAATGLLTAPTRAQDAGLGKVLILEPVGLYALYELEVDGTVVSGVRMFHSPEAGVILVIAPQLPYPIFLVPKQSTVLRLDPAQLEDRPDGSIAYTPTAKPQATDATFKLVDSKPVFELAGKKIRFLDKAPLLGSHTRQDIVAYDSSYDYRAAKADPPTTYLPVINKYDKDVLVKIYFSTQCQVCRELLPNIFKTMDRVKNPKIKFEFYGMPLPAKKDPLAVELKISDFPTGILYGADGKEIGRASGHSWRMPDLAIHNALLGITINPDALRVPPESPKPRP